MLVWTEQPLTSPVSFFSEPPSHCRPPRSGHVDGPPQQPRGGSRAERRRRPRRSRWLDGGGDLAGGCAGNQRSVDPSPGRPAKRVTHAHAARRCAMWHSPRRRFRRARGDARKHRPRACLMNRFVSWRAAGRDPEEGDAIRTRGGGRVHHLRPLRRHRGVSLLVVPKGGPRNGHATGAELAEKSDGGAPAASLMAIASL